ncbi:MAG: hypothetical protein AABY22_31715, partial [Nanoarchaeota archaeon]
IFPHAPKFICPKCDGKGKIPKYKVGDEINGYYHFNSGIGRIIIKLKIISETEDKWRVILE